MRYASGDSVEIGDSVRLEGGARGVVVGLIATAAYAPPYNAKEWEYLGSGVLVEAEDAGLSHYEVPNREWVLVARR